MIETARGPVAGSQLGRVLMHEHLFVLDHELRSVFPVEFTFEEDALVDEAVRRLDELHASGFETIVDLTVLGLGRDIALIQRVASRSPVNIVVATGAYVLRDLPLSLALRGTRFGGPEVMAQLFERDIEQGIGGTEVKAGILKCTTDRAGVTKGVDRLLRAVAHAHLSTGVPISTHTSAAQRVGLDQQRVLAEEGVDLGRVVIGHSGDSDDLDYLEQLIANGSYLGMDRFGLDYFLPFDRRVEIVAELCARGYADRMVLSQDADCCNVHTDRHAMAQLAPRHGYCHIARDVLPALMQRGVTQPMIDVMLVGNPRSILARS